MSLHSRVWRNNIATCVQDINCEPAPTFMWCSSVHGPGCNVLFVLENLLAHGFEDWSLYISMNIAVFVTQVVV